MPSKFDLDLIKQIRNELQFAKTADLWKFDKLTIGPECHKEFSQHSCLFVKFVAEGFISEDA